MSKDNNKPKKFKNDILLIIVFLAIGAVLGLILLFTSHKGSYARVYVDGEIKKELPLNQDTEYEIESLNGGSIILVIEDGYAYIRENDCPDKLCINMGKINKEGQSIVCLPNKLVIDVSEEDPKDDGSNFTAG